MLHHLIPLIMILILVIRQNIKRFLATSKESIFDYQSIGKCSCHTILRKLTIAFKNVIQLKNSLEVPSNMDNSLYFINWSNSKPLELYFTLNYTTIIKSRKHNKLKKSRDIVFDSIVKQLPFVVLFMHVSYWHWQHDRTIKRND